MTSHVQTEEVQFLTKRSTMVRDKVGFLGGATPLAWTDFFEAFIDGLRDNDLHDGVEIDIKPKWAQGRKGNCNGHAQGLVASCKVIVTAGTVPLLAAVTARKHAGSTIPIVVASAGYPGDVSDLGSNVTGFLNGQATFADKRLGQFRKYVTASRLGRMAILANSAADNATAERDKVKAAADAVSLPYYEVNVDEPSGDSVVDKLIAVPSEVKSLYVCTDPFITTDLIQINTLASSKQWPTMYQFRDHVVTGGLMSYGPNFAEMFRNVGGLVKLALDAQTLPPLIPVAEAQLKLVFNRTTAKAVGVSIPGSGPDEFID